MTLSNVASPILQYGDRFIIASLVSVSAMGHYFVASALATSLLVFMGAITSVLMPAVATAIESDATRARGMLKLGVKVALMGMFVPAVALSAVAPEVLGFWLGSPVGEHLTTTLRLLLIGVLFHGVGFIAMSLILGAAKPQITAKLHALELIAYIPVAMLLIWYFGINGAAIAYVLRIACDALLLLWQARRIISAQDNVFRPLAFLTVGAIALAAALLPAPAAARISYASVVAALYCLSAWYWMFSSAEREALLKMAYAEASWVAGREAAYSQDMIRTPTEEGIGGEMRIAATAVILRRSHYGRASRGRTTNSPSNGLHRVVR